MGLGWKLPPRGLTLWAGPSAQLLSTGAGAGVRSHPGRSCSSLLSCLMASQPITESESLPMVWRQQMLLSLLGPFPFALSSGWKSPTSPSSSSPLLSSTSSTLAWAGARGGGRPAQPPAGAGCVWAAGQGQGLQAMQRNGSLWAVTLSWSLIHLHPKLLNDRGQRGEGARSRGPHLELGAEWSAWRKVAVV